jgi:hypothetical protein
LTANWLMCRLPRPPPRWIRTWGEFFDKATKTCQVLDVTGSIVTLFIPGAGTFKIFHGGSKVVAFVRDPAKQAFVEKVFKGIAEGLAQTPRYVPPPPSVKDMMGQEMMK